MSKTPRGFGIIESDLRVPEHAVAFVSLLNSYLQDDMGRGRAVKGAREKKLLKELRAHPAKLILLAKMKNSYVGMAVCFLTYSTFQARPLLNVHDLIVLPAYRRQGIGRKLMAAVGKKARRLGCGKITLEVRYDNEKARRLYASLGYGECCPPMSFWVKALNEA